MQLSFGGIPFDENVIPGLVLVCEGEIEFEEFKSMVVSYYEQPGSKQQIRIGFTHLLGKLDFYVDFGSNIGNVGITGIDPSILKQLKTGLESFDNYALFVAINDPKKGLQLVPPSTFHMCFASVRVDSEIILGNQIINFDWSKLSELEDISRYS